MTEQVNLLVLNDSVIRELLKDPRVIALLPCLNGASQQIASVRPGGSQCGICKGRRNTVENDALTTARSCIRNTRGEALKQLKVLLNARQLRIQYPKAGHVTF